MALHEHAHLAVARELGACGFVRVFHCGFDAGRGAIYSGQFRLYGELSDEDWRVVALAGTLAERVAQVPEIDAATIAGELAAGTTTLSATDAQLAAGFDLRDIERSLSLVRCAGQAIADEVDRLVAEARALQDRLQWPAA